jgi:hypothetical protein
VHLSRCFFAAGETSRALRESAVVCPQLGLSPVLRSKLRRELPYFGAQKNVRLSRDLSAMRNAPFGKASTAAGLLEGNVSFLFYFDENVTVAVRVESAK